MHKVTRTSAVALITTYGLIGCSADALAENTESDIDPLLDGPLGYKWLTPLDFFKENDYLETWREIDARNELDMDWKTEPYDPDEWHCAILEYSSCMIKDHHIQSKLIEYIALAFEDELLTGVSINYPIDASRLSFDEADKEVESVSNALERRIAQRYEFVDEFDNELGLLQYYKGGPVKVEIWGNEPAIHDDGHIVANYVSLRYTFDIKAYERLLLERQLFEQDL